jgi:hypothetical protein
VRFLAHVLGAPFDPGEAYGQVVAEPVQGVDGTRRREVLQGQLGPPGELRGQQSSHERGVDRELARTHRAPGDRLRFWFSV